MESSSLQKPQDSAQGKGDRAQKKVPSTGRGSPLEKSARKGSELRLMVAVIHPADAGRTIQAFNRLGFDVTRMTSTGVFLDQRNVTLLIGLKEEQVPVAMQVLEEHCSQRMEHVPTPVESSTLVIPTTLPIPVGGATVFLLPAEKHERIK